MTDCCVVIGLLEWDSQIRFESIVVACRRLLLPCSSTGLVPYSALGDNAFRFVLGLVRCHVCAGMVGCRVRCAIIVAVAWLA